MSPDHAPLYQLGDLVEYDFDGSIGHKGKVDNIQVVYIYEVRNEKGITYLAPESRWKKVRD